MRDASQVRALNKLDAIHTAISTLPEDAFITLLEPVIQLDKKMFFRVFRGCEAWKHDYGTYEITVNGVRFLSVPTKKTEDAIKVTL